MPNQEQQLKKCLFDVLNEPSFSDIPDATRAQLASEFVWQWAAERECEEPNKGKSWSDAALRLVLQEAPIHANIVKLARAFGRSPGAVEQIYRWAATPDKVVREKRPDDSFIAQIKRIAKEVGWEAF